MDMVGRKSQDKEAGMKDLALKISAVVFLLVSIMHLLRFVFKVEAVIGSWYIPLWLSLLGFIGPMFLSVWIFKLLVSGKKDK